MVELILVYGKGGVGKTTISALMTDYLRDSNKKVACVSIDQQHNVKDIIQRYGLKIDYYESTTEVTEFINFAVEEMGFKGYKEIIPMIGGDFISITSLAKLVWDFKDKYDIIVCDFPPNCLSLRLITIPPITRSIAFRVLTIKSKIKKMITGHDNFLDRAEFFAKVNDFFVQNLNTARHYIVANVDELSLIETIKMKKVLEQHNLPLMGIIINKFVMNNNECRCSLCESYAYLQRTWLGSFYQLNSRLYLIPFTLDVAKIKTSIKNIFI